MEWMIMNCDGLKGLCSSLGVFVDGSYHISDECYDTLTTLLENVQEEDSADHSTRRQLAASHIIQQDLVPLLIDLEDDPEIFQLGIRLLVCLTQPVECLQESMGPKPPDLASVPPWIWEIQSMLIEAKMACSSVKFVKALFGEICKIVDDAGEYNLVESDCETINQCLLLIRNLLYISDSPGQGCLSEISVLFLRILFQCRVDRVLLLLLNTKQKDYWGVTLVQLISLLYRDMVSEIFVRIEDVSSCGEESCDSSNCSRCESAMDRPFPFDPTFERSASKSPSDSSEERMQSFCKEGESTVVLCKSSDSKTLMSDRAVSECQSLPLSKCFRASCKIESVSGHSSSFDAGNMFADCMREENSMSICGESSSMCTLKSSTEKSKSASADSKSTGSSSSMDELGSQLTEFTFSFLQNGFMNLVNVLKDTLMSISESRTTRDLDDSYFLWSIAFFLKFARRKEIDFKKIKDVFMPDVFGFLVYEAISNGEEVLISFKKNRSNTLSMRRLHLSVSALRELIKTLTFHRERGLEEDDIEYVEKLQRDLANMNDLRQLFLWLIRMYQPGCHGILFLRDVIVTNHYYLLLLEEWIGKGFCIDKRVNMLNHVKQFAVTGVMQKYGYLLQNFVRNDHHINNCIFTMMHHVAGDCLRPESLLQVDILKTFLQIWDMEVPITQEMNDLMEYVIQKFLSSAEENPLSCAIQLFTETGDVQEDMFTEADPKESQNGEWSEEEMDKLFMWYAEFEDCPDMVEKITFMFSEIGVKKSQIEIVNHMFKLGWLSSDHLETFVGSDKQMIENPSLIEEEKSNHRCLAVQEELSNLEEDEVVPFCVNKLREEQFDEQLDFIQAALLEAAYVKIDGGYMDKKYLEEPSFKFYHAKGKALPIVFYNDEHEKIRSNIYMLAALQQMGLDLEEETGLMYPRIPSHLSVGDLVDKARMLGKIDEDHVKFDINSAADQITTETKDIFADSEPISKTPRKMAPLKLPSVTWMRLITDYNSADTHSLSATSSQASSSTHSMDIE